MIKKLLAFLTELNSTNAVVVTGIVITVSTTIRYQLSGVHIGPFGFDVWKPDWEWLAFCLALQGVATTQFGVKRTTDIDYMKAKNQGGPSVNVETANVEAGSVKVEAQDMKVTPEKG